MREAERQRLVHARDLDVLVCAIGSALGGGDGYTMLRDILDPPGDIDLALIDHQRRGQRATLDAGSARRGGSRGNNGR